MQKMKILGSEFAKLEKKIEKAALGLPDDDDVKILANQKRRDLNAHVQDFVFLFTPWCLFFSSPPW